MARNNKICVNCQKQYSYCPSCSSDKNKPAWMNLYCSDNCMKLFMAATDYSAGLLTKDEAKKIVNNADLSNKQKFNKGVRKFISEVIPFENQNMNNRLFEKNKEKRFSSRFSNNPKYDSEE